MNALYVLAGVAVALLSLGVFAFGLGYLIRSGGHFMQSLALFLPQAGQFLGQAQDLRDRAETAAAATAPGPAVSAGAMPWPVRRDRGVAPPPIDITSPTEARIPQVEPGDRDWFTEEEGMAARTLAETRAPAPPGPRIAGEP